MGRPNWSSSVTEKIVEPDGAEIVADEGDNVTLVRTAGFRVNCAAAETIPFADAVMFDVIGVLTAEPSALPLGVMVTHGLLETHVNVGCVVIGLLNWSSACAENCTGKPGYCVAVAGVTEIVVRVCPTVMLRRTAFAAL